MSWSIRWFCLSWTSSGAGEDAEDAAAATSSFLVAFDFPLSLCGVFGRVTQIWTWTVETDLICLTIRSRGWSQVYIKWVNMVVHIVRDGEDESCQSAVIQDEWRRDRRGRTVVSSPVASTAVPLLELTIMVLQDMPKQIRSTKYDSLLLCPPNYTVQCRKWIWGPQTPTVWNCCTNKRHYIYPEREIVLLLQTSHNNCI